MITYSCDDCKKVIAVDDPKLSYEEKSDLLRGKAHHITIANGIPPWCKNGLEDKRLLCPTCFKKFVKQYNSIMNNGFKCN